MPRPARNHISVEYATTRLSYNPYDGSFTWKTRLDESGNSNRWNARNAGKIAGSDHAKGYRSIRIDEVAYLAHRLAWLIHYGEWPEHYVDHINGVRSDNRIVNLRAATNTENCHNSRARNPQSGVKGVYYHRRDDMYFAQIGGKYLGWFRTIEEATETVRLARDHLHGEFARHE